MDPPEYRMAVTPKEGDGEEVQQFIAKEKRKEMEEKEEEEEDPYAPPDGGWGWVVMIASFTCNLVLDGIGYVFGVFLQPMMIAFGV